MESYDWRAQEDAFNAALPQFRTLIARPGPAGSTQSSEKDALRTHFVHARSPHANAFPLLYIHSWPGSFIEVARLLPHLTQPSSPDSQRAFHVVCPSIPGFGFSDAAADPEFGVASAAEVFAALMQRLGYDEYVVCGAGWGFEVARALAVREKKRVRAVFTWNPVFERPRVRAHVGAWAKWQIARFTGAKWTVLSFGYVPAEVKKETIDNTESKDVRNRPMGPVLHQLLSARPQTLAFSLCDSPVGLLSVLLDVVGVQGTSSSLGARPRSPFLDPEELEIQDREYEAAGHERVRSDDTVKASQNGGTLGGIHTAHPWSPTDILNWTMM